jgi:hypothetical protein
MLNHKHPVGTPTPGARHPGATLTLRAPRAVARALAITCLALALSEAGAVACPDSPSAPGGAGAGAKGAHLGNGAWLAQTPPERSAAVAKAAATQSPCPPTTRVVHGPAGTGCATPTGSPDVVAAIAILVVASLLVTWQALAAFWRRSHRSLMEMPQTQQ